MRVKNGRDNFHVVRFFERILIQINERKYYGRGGSRPCHFYKANPASRKGLTGRSGAQDFFALLNGDVVGHVHGDVIFRRIRKLERAGVMNRVCADRERRQHHEVADTRREPGASSVPENPRRRRGEAELRRGHTVVPDIIDGFAVQGKGEVRDETRESVGDRQLVCGSRAIERRLLQTRGLNVYQCDVQGGSSGNRHIPLDCSERSREEPDMSRLPFRDVEIGSIVSGMASQREREEPLPLRRSPLAVTLAIW